ncbi:MAG: methyl-accepting chemotaxis protein, partial [Comamonas sp.]
MQKIGGVVRRTPLQRDVAIETMTAECRPRLAALLGALKEYVDANTEEGNLAVASAESRYNSARLQLLGASVLGVIAAILLGGWITRNLFAALGGEPQDAARLARAVAEGNLTTEVRLQGGDTFSLMAQLEAMQESLAGVVANVRRSARGVAAASVGIEDGNGDLKARTESQASALEETAASMEQLGSTVRQNADNALSANQLAVAASQVASQGGAVVGKVVDTMKGINESSQRIADIIGVIDSIAFQTNIL